MPKLKASEANALLEQIALILRSISWDDEPRREDRIRNMMCAAGFRVERH